MRLYRSTVNSDFQVEIGDIENFAYNYCEAGTSLIMVFTLILLKPDRKHIKCIKLGKIVIINNITVLDNYCPI